MCGARSVAGILAYVRYCIHSTLWTCRERLCTPLCCVLTFTEMKWFIQKFEDESDTQYNGEIVVCVIKVEARNRNT